jgi:hypothetical protein
VVAVPSVIRAVLEAPLISPVQEKPMTSKHANQSLDPVTYQQSLCDEETLQALAQSARPSPARFYAVARGESEWTTQERALIDATPGLREYEARMLAAVRSALPGPVTIPLRRVTNQVRDGHEVRAVAQGACQSSDTLRLVNTQAGYDVLLFPADEDGNATVRFVGSVPQAPVTLLVDDVPVVFVKPIDQYGYAVVRAEPFRLVRSGAAELHIRIE